MIEDVENIPTDTRLECDILIIGSGAAGIPCACELINSGKNVILIESGGFELESATQDLADGELIDPTTHGPLKQFRKRMFGGTTSVWGGRCAPFDGIDFEKRDYVSHSGWPICAADLEPYYRRAHEYTLTGDYDYNTASSLSTESPMIPGLRDDIWLQDRLWRFSLPTNYGSEFRERIQSAENVKVLLHANALKLLTCDTGQAIRGVKVGSLDGKMFEVAAPKVIVAAGGLETTRLMLLSDDVHKNGLGNTHDQLGRYYSSHVSGDLGEVKFKTASGALVWQYERTSEGVYVKRHIRPREEIQKREELLNFRCILTHPPFAQADHGNGVLSAVYLVKRFFKGQIPPEYSKELSEAGYHNVPQHMKNVVLGSPSLLRFATHWFFKRTIARRKYPSVSLRSKSNTYTIHFDAEQSPNPESRILLSEQRDSFGLPKIKVDWRGTDQDIASVAKWHGLLKQEIEASGVGEVIVNEEQVPDIVRKGFGVGSHHIGTTRMSDGPENGVVDRDCQVHGVAGLYLASPSVFPTASFANPVLTITALAIRIADKLKSGS